MPSYLAPDVYVEEVDSGNKPIEGVSTSITGFVGMTQRGPASGLPQLVTSFSEFRQIYGGYFDFGTTFQGHNTLPFAVDGFFTNLGSLLYISRVLATGASKATGTSQGGLVTRLLQDTSMATGKKNLIRPATLRGIQAGTQLLLRMVKNGVVTDSATIAVTSIDRNSGVVTLAADLAALFEAKYTIVFTDVNGIDANGAITALATPLTARPNSFDVTAIDEGSWGKDIIINVFHESAGRAPFDTFVSGAVDNNQVTVKSAANFYPGAWVEIDRGNTKDYRQIKAVTGVVLTLSGPAMAAADFTPQLAAPNDITFIATTEFRMIVTYDGRSEQYSGLTFENVPGRYYVDQINKVSSLIQVSAMGGPPAGHPFMFPSGPDGLQITLPNNGVDGTAAPGDADYIGQDNGPGLRTGIQSLIDIDSISIV